MYCADVVWMRGALGCCLGASSPPGTFHFLLYDLLCLVYSDLVVSSSTLSLSSDFRIYFSDFRICFSDFMVCFLDFLVCFSHFSVCFAGIMLCSCDVLRFLVMWSRSVTLGSEERCNVDDELEGGGPCF